MNKVIIGLICAAGMHLYSGDVAAQTIEKTKSEDLLKYVNTFIGTDDAGNTFPGARFHLVWYN